MSQSPQDPSRLYGSNAFQDALASLDQMIFQGRSFSGGERHCAFLNLGQKRFANVSAVSGLDWPDDGRAVAATDWDQDGDLDLWIVNRTAPQLRLMLNQLPSANRFLALRLQGVNANRDAIGARVTVELKGATDRPLVQSLQAGEAFLSQSSKWLHFGLGATGEVSQVTVRWPAGKSEIFQGIGAGGRYLLVEASGRARPLASGSRALALGPSASPVVESSSSSALWLASRPPMPSLQYKTFQREERPLPVRKKPLLVNLWATWCGPCRGELQDLSSQREALSKKVDLLALSVDGLGDDGSDPETARKFLEDLNVPFESGMATPRLLESLELLHRLLIDLRQPLALPSSFLIDRHGALAAVYQGAVDLARLDEDLQALDAPSEALQRRAALFAGRWASDPPLVSFSAIAQGFLDQGSPQQAAAYLSQARRQQKSKPGYEDPTYPEASNNLGLALAAAGRLEDALDHYREALRLRPSYSKARNNLAVALASLGRHSEAIRQLRQALHQKPQDAELHSNLGTVLMQQGKVEEAIESLRAALEINPRMPRTLYILSLAQDKGGSHQEASDTAKQALDLALSSGQSDLAGQIRESLKLFRRHINSGQPQGR